SDRTWRRTLPKLGRDDRATVDDEIRLHLEMRAADLVASGMAPDEAMREAERRFGDRARVAAEMRALERRKAGSAVRQRPFADFWKDVTYAMRSLARQPLFVITAVLTLGLGIGVNAAIFSAVESFLLRPLPVRAADRLTVLNYITSGSDLPSQITYLN